MRPLVGAASRTGESAPIANRPAASSSRKPDRVGIVCGLAGRERLASRTSSMRGDAVLANIVCARTTSNAIVIGERRSRSIGVGCGQQSRVDAGAIAVKKAGERASGAAAASDAFFTFRDALDVLAGGGVVTVVHPGGSVRDDETAAAASEAGVTLLASGERHFRH